MGVVLGLLLGAGLCLVWTAWWAPTPRTRRSDGWAARTQDLLVQAGATGVTPGGLVGASVVVGVVVALAGFVFTRSGTISLAFALLAGGSPRCSSGRAPDDGAWPCARCGPRSWTTWRRACGRGCRCPRPSRSSASAGPSS
ncbi:hypothetical protein GCM10025864_44050 [Luteimicrobium album]|uniref:Uncharacterized protein n=1 Tax=Luteimicrobium album TaxID=1054550 RepID=A0ABQ6I7H4_9MICO|nr:hypothetical protein GCM10025864_44050 [Luteimicrobium album]